MACAGATCAVDELCACVRLLLVRSGFLAATLGLCRRAATRPGSLDLLVYPWNLLCFAYSFLVLFSRQ